MVDEGLAAEFGSPQALLCAVQQLHARGYARMDTFSPYPLEGLPASLSRRPRSITTIASLAAVVFGASAYVIQWVVNVELYPLDVGGRPLHAALSFVPITFEMAVLGAAIAGVAAMLAGCKLPRLWRPLMEVEGFERANIDRFWLWVDRNDPCFDPEGTRNVVMRHQPLRVFTLVDDEGGPQP